MLYNRICICNVWATYCITIRNVRASFMRSLNPRELRERCCAGKRMNNRIKLYISRDSGDVTLCVKFHRGNPCGINGGNALFKLSPYRGAKAYSSAFWNCHRLTEYDSSWSNGANSVIHITANASACISAKCSLRFNVAYLTP